MAHRMRQHSRKGCDNVPQLQSSLVVRFAAAGGNVLLDAPLFGFDIASSMPTLGCCDAQLTL
eukprot:5173560-Amphidinium_carterae.1